MIAAFGGRAAKSVLCSILLGSILSPFNLYSQTTTLWDEDFSGLANGTTVDTNTTRWTRDVSACDLTTDGFDVQGGQFTMVDTDDESVWASEWIDISGHPNVTILFNITGARSLDAGFDYMRGYYNVRHGRNQCIR